MGFQENCQNKDHKSERRKQKTLPYGATRGLFWCCACDTDTVPSWSKSIKKRERQKAKREIRETLQQRPPSKK